MREGLSLCCTLRLFSVPLPKIFFASLLTVRICAGVVAALFANQIDKVAQQSKSNGVKTILNVVVVLLALLVLLLVIKSITHTV